MRNFLDVRKSTPTILLACLVFCSLTWVGLAQTLQEYRRQVGRLIQDYKWGEALELATAALAQHPEDPQLLVAAAALMLQMGQPENGEKMIEAAVSTTVEDPDLLGVMAELKLSRGR